MVDFWTWLTQAYYEIVAGNSDNECIIHIGAAVCSRIAQTKLFEGIQIQFCIHCGGGGLARK
jgi:hypothetical protein